MKLPRLNHDPAALIDLFEEGLTALGAVSERTWHDRLLTLAEGRAASLWPAGETLVERELRFLPPDAPGARDAETEIFPGCPLTFRLAETLQPRPLPLEQGVLDTGTPNRPPAPDVVGKLWLAQFPQTTRLRLLGSFHASWHFSVLLLVRCEVQAIDQHWSLHRVALALPRGQRDESLASQFSFSQVQSSTPEPVPWPSLPQELLHDAFHRALSQELEDVLDPICERQTQYLKRELERVDGYFTNYERELRSRAGRSRVDATKLKLNDRLAAARAEHQRRRQDQVQRHDIRVVPHLDAALLIAEPAWAITLDFVEDHRPCQRLARFIPRSRQWFDDLAE